MCAKVKALLVCSAANLLLSSCLNGRFVLRASDCPNGQSRPSDGVACVPNSSSAAKLAASNCKDPDLAALRSGVEVTMCDGSTGIGTMVDAEDVAICSSDGQVNCLATSDFPVAKKSLLEANDLRYGKTVAGIAGSMRDMRQCRNAAHLATWDAAGVTNIGSISPTFTADATNVDVGSDELNWDPTVYHLTADLPVYLTVVAGVMPGGLTASTTYYVIVSGAKIKLAASAGGAAINITSTGSGTLRLGAAGNGIADGWDTIEDANNGSPIPPSASPWSADYVCDNSNFSDLSAAGSPGLIPPNTTPAGATAAFSQVWRDELTGLYFTNILYNGAGTVSWAGAVAMCAGLDSGDGAGNWRLPTQKEMLQLYIDGVSRLVVNGGSWNSPAFRSVTAGSNSPHQAWYFQMGTAQSYYETRHSTVSGVFCVR